ncbi:MAG: helix-hairpin-helix domain-containing protein [Chloroflexi bacterium]|nr:helix-hairpin-helix domain-containing protein [Chloroflexota bacterium]
MNPSAAPWRAFETAETNPITADPVARSRPGSPDRTEPAPLPRPVLVGALLAIILLAVGAVALASTGRDGSAVLVGAATGSPGPDASCASGVCPGARVVVIDVAGAVLRPGVYRLPLGARVGDAIRAAGGYGPRVDAASASTQLNLAAALTDGQQVRVPSRDDPPSRATIGGGGTGATGGGAMAGSRVDLNRATQAELEALPGIGPSTAAKIIASRSTTAFKTIQELRDRKLVGQKTFDGLKDLVTVR